MMGSQMGSQMISGVGMSGIPTTMSGTELDTVGSQFKTYGDSANATSMQSLQSQVCYSTNTVQIVIVCGAAA